MKARSIEKREVWWREGKSEKEMADHSGLGGDQKIGQELPSLEGAKIVFGGGMMKDDVNGTKIPHANCSLCNVSIHASCSLCTVSKQAECHMLAVKQHSEKLVVTVIL